MISKSALSLVLLLSTVHADDDVTQASVPDQIEETFDDAVESASAYLDANQWIFSIIMILGGLLFLFFGWKLYRIIVALSGFSLGYVIFNVITQYICYAASDSMNPDTIMWIAFGVGVVGGIIGAVLAWKIKQIGVAIIGILFGFVVGINLDLVIQGFYVSGGGSSYPAWASWLTYILCAIIACVLAVKLMKPMVIVSTACTGSFATLRGIGELSKTWPRSLSNVDSYDELGNVDLEDPAVWGFMGGMIVLAIIGIAIQCKFFGDVKHDDDDGNKYKK